MKNDTILNEMMSHVPILAHGRVERVLIVGPTGRGLAREVLRHRGVRTVVQVHADDGLVAAASSAGPRYRFEPADAAAFLASTHDRFDLVLAPGLVSESALRNARGSLAAGGLVITTLGAPFVQPRRFFTNMRSLTTVFAEAAAYLVPVPGTFGGPQALGWGSSVSNPRAAMREVLAARLADARIETGYYTAEIHRASFALPRFVQELVSAAASPREEIGADPLGLVMSRLDSRETRHA